MDIELKECPFDCGGEVADIEVQRDYPDEVYVRCGFCGAEGERFGQKEHAIEAWNRRVSDGQKKFEAVKKWVTGLKDTPDNFIYVSTLKSKLEEIVMSSDKDKPCLSEMWVANFLRRFKQGEIDAAGAREELMKVTDQLVDEATN